MGSVGSAEIPIISIDRMLYQTWAPSAKIITAVADAFEHIGFMVIADHGIDESLLADMRDISSQLFTRSIGDKARYSATPPNRYRGYANSLLGGIGYGTSETGGKLDYVESFEVGPWDSAHDMLAAGYGGALVDREEFNIWPVDLPDFRRVWLRYYEALTHLADDILAICALALDLPADWFRDKFDRRPSHLAVNYYPSQEHSEPSRQQLRQKAHTDIGAITLLLQADSGGLQVHHRSGTWIDVPVLPNSFVVNLGDLMAKWTNDRWVATPHRVLNPSAAFRHVPRISIPFFDRPNLDALIECIPTCVGAGPRYEPVMAADWVEYRQSMYGQQVKG